MKNPLKGEIWLADFSGSRGHEQKKKRPTIIIRDLT
ncbi:MAG: type II toxin-antitoxin system PemK/MazF family toxin [Candidatus Micrarchaeia archaeon]|jgi:mRNA-degrading endonuclease toxin of MazEF toxin-antitoxin module